ncbi:hypothetical protein E2562_001674, partial [Oryza meyeriana var. granulata]
MTTRGMRPMTTRETHAALEKPMTTRETRPIVRRTARKRGPSHGWNFGLTPR